MRLHRFYLHTPITETVFDITDKEMVHQWKNVFRYNVGSQVVLFDGTGSDFLSVITGLQNSTATVSVISYRKTTPPKRKVGIALSLLKKENTEMVIQKATELGASTFIPIVSERSEKKNLNIERARKIIMEASEQSGRGDLMQIYNPVSLKKFLKEDFDFRTKIAFHPTGAPFVEFEKKSYSDTVLVFIGPEGGYSDDEIELFKEYGVSVYSLGESILRGETAAITALSLLMLA